MWLVPSSIAASLPLRLVMGLRRQKVRECGGAATEGQGASRDSRKADIREWRLLAVSGYQSPGRSSARI